MAFEAFRREVEKNITLAADKLGYKVSHIPLEEPPRPQFGDLSSTIAFDIAKTTRKKPFEIAEELHSAMEGMKHDLVSEVSVSTPAYLNFRVDKPKFSTMALYNMMKEKPGYIDVGKGKKVIVEHTSVNPNKALHIGHIRNVVIGDTIQRLLKYTNHDVTVLNYVDDSGLQVADIIVGFRFLGFPENPSDPKMKFDHYCGDQVYVKVNQIYSEKPETEQYRRVVLKEMEDYDSEIFAYSKTITERVLLEQLKTCSAIGAYYDCLNFESHIFTSGMWQEVFQKMKDNNLVNYEGEGENAGCWIIKGGGDQDKILIRSDGTLTYIAKDIPYAAWKLGLIEDFFKYVEFFKQPNGSVLWRTTLSDGVKDHPSFNNADAAINVIDVRQAWLQKIITIILKELGEKGKEKNYIHLGYEIVSLSRDTAKEMGLKVEKDFVHMSGRAGIYINADDVLEKLQKLAYIGSKQRNPEADEEWLITISTSLAVSAMRYSLVKQDFKKILVFDLNEALKIEGETGPYLQYTFARASRIIEKYGEPVKKSFSITELNEIEEYMIVKELSKMDTNLKDSVENLQTNKLAEYAHSICLLFNTFYEKYPVLHEKNEAKKEQRLILVSAFANALKTLMNILGIEAHKRI
jgi:arginyl-tRNA synthetase